jgi:hypothetical protein
MLGPDAFEGQSQLPETPGDWQGDLKVTRGAATTSWEPVDCRFEAKPALATPLSQSTPPGYLQRSSLTRSEPPRLLVWNANSHGDRHGQGCPSAPAMQHSGGAELTAALHR